MLKQNGYAQYQNSRIVTASPAELTLMLYEGAIKFGNIAIAAMENKNPAKAHENIVKVEKIIQNFSQPLCFQCVLRRSAPRHTVGQLRKGEGVFRAAPFLCGVAAQAVNADAAKQAGKIGAQRMGALGRNAIPSCHICIAKALFPILSILQNIA